MDDRPPDVRILRPAADQQITPLEEVAIEARAEDDYGIARFELVYAVAGREPKVVPFARSTGSTLAQGGDAHAGGRGSRRAAGRRDYLLRAGARRRPRQAADRDPQRHLLPGGPAVLRRVRRWRRARPCRAWRASRSKRSSRRRKRSSTRPGTSSGARRRARAVGGRHHGDCRGAGRAEDARRADGVARRTRTRGRSAFRSRLCRRDPRRAQGGRLRAGRPIRWARRSRP